MPAFSRDDDWEISRDPISRAFSSRGADRVRIVQE